MVAIVERRWRNFLRTESSKKTDPVRYCNQLILRIMWQVSGETFATLTFSHCTKTTLFISFCDIETMRLFFNFIFQGSHFFHLKKFLDYSSISAIFVLTCLPVPNTTKLKYLSLQIKLKTYRENGNIWNITIFSNDKIPSLSLTGKSSLIFLFFSYASVNPNFYLPSLLLTKLTLNVQQCI